ncbi:putative hydrolase of the HAD superfamily [Microcella putealis]|uniref:Putative hydrolase of the HAD superfamily n=1 Tax=Microcella putealis TaxID=337005 RepID=A0A4Q7LVS8_9MICO|nr:HAD-IA family hydrolase [Microcella putealis]RZS59175.1 putative hydrolase of the HAD superfamily [Microcella putealis]TQM24201.1 putative hydrolase of the HAD superfamily [Microcella putealis]
MLFLFDMDDVLCDYDWRTRMAELTVRTGHDLTELRRRWWLSGLEFAAEAGEPSDPEEYLRVVGEAIGQQIPRSEWVRIRAEATTPRPDALAAVARAQEFGRVALLTNNSILIHEHLTEVAPELAELMGAEHLHASARFGARKPDPLVYARAMAHYGASAADTFFVDDRSENVAGAESLGITGHVYRDAAGLTAAIERFAQRAAA